MYREVVDISDSVYILANHTVYMTKDREDLVKYGYIKNSGRTI